MRCGYTYSPQFCEYLCVLLTHSPLPFFLFASWSLFLFLQPQNSWPTQRHLTDGMLSWGSKCKTSVAFDRHPTGRHFSVSTPQFTLSWPRASLSSKQFSLKIFGWNGKIVPLQSWGSPASPPFIHSLVHSIAAFGFEFSTSKNNLPFKHSGTRWWPNPTSQTLMYKWFI